MLTHKQQCVLYSEIDNVTSVNKGWDVGAGVGWNLSYPYLSNGSVPPTGIRSAVPLGGMGTGNFELRGDGTFRQWCIESQSPGGGAKLDIGALDEAVLGVKIGHKAALLRTRPPAGLPGVAAMTYEGAVPVSKLSVKDSNLGADVDLYAHGEIIPWDYNGSMTPAVAFTLTVSNPAATPVDVSLLLSMPLASQPNTARMTDKGTLHPGAQTPLACKTACDEATDCNAWSFAAQTGCSLIAIGGVPQNVFAEGVTSGIKGIWTGEEPGTLVHDRAVAAKSHPPGPAPAPAHNLTCATSPIVHGRDIAGSVVPQPSPTGGAAVSAVEVPEGEAGYDACRKSCCESNLCKAWVVSADNAPKGAAPPPACKPGKPCCWHKGGAAGYSIGCPFCTSSVWDASSHPDNQATALNEQVGNFALHAAPGDGATASRMTSDTLRGIWSQFAAASGGEIENQMPISPTAVHGAVSNSITVPPGGNRSVTIVFGWHFATRYMTGEPIGNYYATHLHNDAASAAAGLAARLPQVVETIHGWHKAFFGATSLPVWLQDVIVNSMSQWRSAFMTADGRWRQWEAYDCVDLDSVHNDYQRQMPYALFFPSFVKNVMTTGWAKLQNANGMIAESLSGGCMGATAKLDSGGGRVMGDVSTIFVIETLQLYEWTADQAFLDQLKETVLRAVGWFGGVGTAGTPLPHRQCCTYDIIDFASYDHTSFNSFIYLAAMRAGERLGAYLNNASLSADCKAKADQALPYLNQTLWNHTAEYFRAWQDSKLGAPPWMMADTLYGQVIANTLGLTGGANASAPAWLVPKRMVGKHLEKEALYNPSPYGLTVVTTTGAPPEAPPPPTTSCTAAVGRSKYDSVWMGGAPDWAALQISLGQDGVGLPSALAMAEKELDHYRVNLRDQWNIHGLTANDGYGVDGQPWCTAHYGFHMPLWHIPFAMSGQIFSAVTKTLTFAPTAPDLQCNYTLPVMVPGAVGLLTCGKPSAERYDWQLTVTLGSLDLNVLGIISNGAGPGAMHDGPVSLGVGETAAWSTK
jgi:non-lysosomal glucosylceramidase